MNNEAQVILCTVPDMDSAGTIASTLVNEQLAACVNIIPGITSVYRWKGAVEQDSECLLLIKTTRTRWSALESRIKTLHPYELTEIIAVPLATGQQDYLQWISDSLK